MEIIAFRHGIALEPGQAENLGLSDAERPLTEKGRRRTRSAAAGLRATLSGSRIKAVVSSTHLRAQQTAEILLDYLDDPPLIETRALLPDGDVRELDSWLHGRAPDAQLLLVGHEPQLSRWVSWSLSRKTERFLGFKKAGACLLEFPGPAEGGTGSLRWLLTGAQLRALG